MKSKNVVWHKGHIQKEDRSKLLGYKNKVLWFTGLSGSGKSTIAHELEKKLYENLALSKRADCVSRHFSYFRSRIQYN